MALADSILGLLKSEGPQSDAAIAKKLRVSHQQVNQVARRLAEQLSILRDQGPEGSILNRMPGQPIAPVPPSGLTERGTNLLSEDEIKRAVAHHLEQQGYKVEVMWGRARGIDIDARSPTERVIIEAKGQVQSQPQQTNYFLNALGELVQRMSDPDAIYALALPDEPRSRGLVDRLPALARERLRLKIFFVRREAGETTVRES